MLDSAAPEETLRAYVQLYLREEIKGEALVRNLPGFARFLPIAALFHGQVVNVAGIARDAGVARTTVGGYLEILEDTLLVSRLPAFEARLRVRERERPKLYWVDPGIVRTVKGARGAVLPEEGGALFEGWVHTLLRTYMTERDLADEIAYWSAADARNVEADFVLRRGRDLCAIEAKSTRRYNVLHLKGLRAMEDLPNLRRRLLVFRGSRPFTTEDGIEVLPVSVRAWKRWERGRREGRDLSAGVRMSQIREVRISRRGVRTPPHTSNTRADRRSPPARSPRTAAERPG